MYCMIISFVLFLVKKSLQITNLLQSEDGNGILQYVYNM